MHDTFEQPKVKKSRKHRHRELLDRENLEEPAKKDEPSVSPTMDNATLEEEPSEEPKDARPVVDIEKYLEDNDQNVAPEDEYFGHLPSRTELHKTYQPQTFSPYPEDVDESFDNTNVDVPSDTTHDFPEAHESPSPVNIQQYLGKMVDDKIDGVPMNNGVEQMKPSEPYAANKEIQRLMEKVSDDEQEPENVVVPRQTIEVILVDETKKKKKKKPKKTQDPKIDTSFNDIQLPKAVPEAKERVDTKEIAVQTIPVPDDMDSEDDSDQELLQYQRSMGGYLINTIPEEQEDESPLPTPDENNFSYINEENRKRDFLFRDIRDHESTPRHPYQRREEPTHSDGPVSPSKYISESIIQQDEAKPVESYVPNHNEKYDSKRISHPAFTADSFLPTPIDEKPTEQTKPWENGSPQVETKEPYNINSYQPQDTISTEQFSETIYKPRYEIHDFLKEGERQPDGALVPAPHSQILLEDELSKRKENVPVAGKPELVKPSYQPKYEVHDFIKQDVQEKYESSQNTGGNKFMPEKETQDEKPYSAKTTTLYQLEYQNENVSAERPSKEVRSESGHPNYKARVELVDSIANDENRFNKEPNYIKSAPTAHEEPKVLQVNQPRYEIKNFVLEEQPGNVDKAEESESTLQNNEDLPSKTPGKISQQTYQLRYEIKELRQEEEQFIQQHVPKGNPENIELENGPASVRPVYHPNYERQPVFNESKSTTTISLDHQETEISRSSYQPRYKIPDVVLEDQSESNTTPSKYLEVKTRITASVPIVEREPESIEERPKQKHTSPVYQPRDEIQNFVLENHPPEFEDHPQEKIQSISEISPTMEEPKPTRSFRRPKISVNEYYLEEDSQSEEEKPKEIRSTIQPPEATKIRKFVLDEDPEIVPPEKTNTEETLEYEIPELTTKTKVREFAIEEQTETKSIPKRPTTDEMVQSNPETMVEYKPEFYRTFEPRPEIKAFVVDEDPGRKQQNLQKIDETPVAFQEPDITRLETKTKVREFVIEEQPEVVAMPERPETDKIPEIETKTTVREFIIEEQPENKDITERPATDQIPERETKIEVREFVIEEQPQSKDTPERPATDKIPEIERKTTVREFVIEEQPQSKDTLERPATDKIPERETKTTVREFVIEEQPENKDIPERPATNKIPERETKIEVREFVIEERPQSKDTPERPATDKIPEIERKTTVREFVIEEQPENKDTPETPATEETVQISKETTVEDEPDFYRPFEPRHQVKTFELNEEPLIKRDQGNRYYKTRTDKTPVVIQEPDVIQTVNSPTYEIPDLETKTTVREFVIEEQPEKKDTPEPTATEETVQTSKETIVEDEPDFYRPFEPRYEVKTFELNEESLVKQDQENRYDKTRVGEIPVVIQEPDITQTVNSPKYEIPDLETKTTVRKFVIEEQPKNKDVSERPTTDKIPEIETKTKVREFAIEEQPENKDTLERPTTGKIPELKTKTTVRQFVIEEQPENRDTPEHPATDKIPELETKTTVREFVIAEQPEKKDILERPTTDRIAEIKAKTEVREFVIEEQPKNKDIPERPTTDKIPEIETKTKVREFAIEEQPENKDTLERPTTGKIPELETKTTVRQFVIEEQPENKDTPERPATDKISELETKTTVREFVIEEQPESKDTPERPATEETVQISRETIVEDEPKFYRPFEPRYEVKTFELNEESLVKQDQENRYDKARVDEIPVVIQEPDITQTVTSPKYEIPDLETKTTVTEFVIEEQPQSKDIPEPPATDRISILETKTEVREFVTEEQPENKDIPGGPVTDKITEIKTKTTVREFVIEEQPDNKDIPERPAADKIPEIETKTAVREFVIEEQPDNKDTPGRPATDKIPEIETKTTVREFVIEEQPDDKDVPEGPVTDRIPEIETKTAVREFVIEEQPEWINKENSALKEADITRPKCETPDDEPVQKEPSRLEITHIDGRQKVGPENEISPHLIKRSSLREVDVRKTPVISSEEAKQGINREVPSIQKKTVTIYPSNKPQGITIQLVDDIPEPDEVKYEGTAVIEKIVVDEPARLQNRTVHTTTYTSEQYESEITSIPTAGFVESVQPENTSDTTTDPSTGNVTITVTVEKQKDQLNEEPSKTVMIDYVDNVEETIEKREVRSVEIKTITEQNDGELEREPIYTLQPVDHLDREHELVTITTEQTTNENEISPHLIKRSSLREVDVRETPVISSEETKKGINREVPSIQKKTVTIYPSNKPQGITIQLVDDIQEPAEVKYEGTAVIEKIVVDEPARLQNRTVHTTTYTSNTVKQYKSEITNKETVDFVENVIPPENVQLQFVREFQTDVPTTAANDCPDMVKEQSSINIYKTSESSAIQSEQERSPSGRSASFSKTSTWNGFEKVDLVNNEEVEITSISSGTSSVDIREDLTMHITPKPSALTITEMTTSNQKIYQPHEEPSGTTTNDSFETVEKRKETSVEIMSVAERDELDGGPKPVSMLTSPDFGDDQEHIYARVDKKPHIHDQNKHLMEKQAKTVGDSIVINHQPGATVIAMAGRDSSDSEETGTLVMEAQIEKEEAQIVQKRSIRETETNDQGNGVVWMTIRHNKKLFDADNQSKRVIVLPIVNKLPSDNFSPMENLDMDFENDGEMFGQRRKDDTSGESNSNATDANTYANKIAENEEISRRTARETLAVAENTGTESDVWCTVKMKRWESDIRGKNWQIQSREEDVSDRFSSTGSIDGSYGNDSSRAQSPNSEFSGKSDSSDPWISIRKKRKKHKNVNAVRIKSNKESNVVKRSSSRSSVGENELVGYSMQITATDDGPLMTQEETLSSVESFDTESTEGTSMGDATTLPWIQVQKRDSIKQRLSFSKKKRDGSLKGVPHTTDHKDRLLLLKIPSTMLLKMENDDKMSDTEVEIPWVELDQSTGKLSI